MKKNDIIQIAANKFIAQGKCLSEINGKKILIENSIPGEIVRAKVTKIRKDYIEAVAVEILKSSENRVTPRCSHFGICGGCKIQYMDYSAQLEAKREIVIDTLKRIAKLNNIRVNQIVGSNEIFFYRNKMEYSFSDKRWLIDEEEYSKEETQFALGLHVPNRFDKVLHINECLLQSDFSNRIRNFIGDFLMQRQATIHSLKNKNGLLKALVIRESFNTTNKMVNIITSYFDERLMFELGEEIKIHFPEVTTVVNNISSANLSSTLGYETKIIFGTGAITEKLLGYDFEISSNTFFQTNTKQAEKMFSFVQKVVSEVKIKEGNSRKILIDLFCGTGAIGIILSRYFDKVYGIEGVEESITVAKINSERNSINNIEFFAQDLNKGFNIKNLNKESDNITLILDPPRAGVHKKTLKVIKKLMPHRIIYISCNPSTQARDIQEFLPNYRVNCVQPFDLFPHTYHIENIIVLEIL